MLQTRMSEQVRFRLTQSMPVIERHREALVRAIQNRITGFEETDEPFGQGDVAATMLVTLLIDCAGDIAAFGTVRDLRANAAEYSSLHIDGRHYSRFGMALAAVMREVLGPRVSPHIVSAWCDTYWYVIGQLSPSDALPVWGDNIHVVR